MIKFKKIRWANFLATGNAGNEINLDTKHSTLIIGKNGSGKSTMVEAVCFALFGKPYRNINKPQVVNSITNKNCRVEIEFDIGKKKYNVVRGIKPAIFEIWQNGVLLNQDAASLDYQAFLEDNILKMNYKSFTQIVILGTASYVPFMQLTSGARREIIEELLDIKIFTAMNVVLKERMSALKSQLQQIDNKITLAKGKAQIQQDYIKQLQKDKDVRLQELVDKKKATTEEIRTLKKQIEQLDIERESYVATIIDRVELSAELTNAVQEELQAQNTIARLQKDLQFYHDSSVCPKCKQGIDHDFKTKVVAEQQTLVDDTVKKLPELQKISASLKQSEKQIKDAEANMQKLQIKIAGLKSEVATLDKYVGSVRKEFDDIESRIGAFEEEQKKLKDIAKDALGYVEERGKLVDEQQYHEMAAIMLKDTGIKTRVIKQYLPSINMLVNKYLTIMDFFVMFTLDEKFNEVIKSRYRDEFSYESFSEGEKQRIDLALLFTWRHIAKTKNSANTNLLILDEVFDSSLDHEGTGHVLALLKDVGTNVFVISHKGDMLLDKFKNVIKFETQKNFSVIAK